MECASFPISVIFYLTWLLAGQLTAELFTAVVFHLKTLTGLDVQLTSDLISIPDKSMTGGAPPLVTKMTTTKTQQLSGPF